MIENDKVSIETCPLLSNGLEGGVMSGTSNGYGIASYS
jgi:hypothetical protein